MKISIVIPTHNRAETLRNAMDSVLRLQGEAEFEFVIVDNNSSDSTEDVVRAAAADLPVRYVKEGRQGLSHARNRALVEYRGQVLLFTDDDVVLDPHWLRAYADAFDTHAHAAYFGGRILPLWDGERPRWVRDEGMALISGVLVHYDLGTEDLAHGDLARERDRANEQTATHRALLAGSASWFAPMADLLTLPSTWPGTLTATAAGPSGPGQPVTWLSTLLDRLLASLPHDPEPGQSAELEHTLRRAGIDDFVFEGRDVAEALRGMWDAVDDAAEEAT